MPCCHCHVLHHVPLCYYCHVLSPTAIEGPLLGCLVIAYIYFGVCASPEDNLRRHALIPVDSGHAGVLATERPGLLRISSCRFFFRLAFLCN